MATLEPSRPLRSSPGRNRDGCAKSTARDGVVRIDASPSVFDPGTMPPSGTVIARHPNHVWGADFTMVPTALGFWVPWMPFAILQQWPFVCAPEGAPHLPTVELQRVA